MENNYEKYEHSVGKIMMHLEWCTKYRYKMFQKFEYRNFNKRMHSKVGFEKQYKNY